MPEEPTKESPPPPNTEAELRSMAHELHSAVVEMRHLVRSLKRTVDWPSVMISCAAFVMATVALWRTFQPAEISQTQEVNVDADTDAELKDQRIRDILEAQHAGGLSSVSGGNHPTTGGDQ